MALEQSSDSAYLVNEMVARLRSLESKHTLLSEQVLVMNKNMIDEYKQLVRQMQLINGELKDMRLDMMKVKDVVRDIAKDMELFARKDKVQVLEKYIDFWNPLHFMTEEEVRKIVREEYGKASTIE